MLRVQMKSARTTGAQRRVEMIASQLTDFRVPLAAAADYVREQTRQRFEARGFGEWPPLAESTVARKASQGYADPTRQLYASGNLFESVTSAHGPYSFTELTSTFVVIGVDWQVNGWQIPVVLSEGAGNIPARPIWPKERAVVNGVSRIIRNWVRAPVEPLALGGAGGTWAGANTPPLP
jgi:hypothetical protein